MPETKPQLLLHTVGKTDKGAFRKINEDAFTITDLTSNKQLIREPTQFWIGNKGALLAVVDGLDTHPNPIVGSILIESLHKGLHLICEPIQIPNLIKNAVRDANREILETVNRNPDHEGMNAQLAAVLIYKAQAFIAAIGRSLVHVIRNQKIYQITKDQNFNFEFSVPGITKIKYVPWIGSQLESTLELKRLDLRRGDILILCSDGLHTLVNDKEILQTIKASPNHPTACSKLIELANQRGGYDNITVVIGEISGDGLPTPNLNEPFAQTLHIIQEIDYDTPNG